MPDQPARPAGSEPTDRHGPPEPLRTSSDRRVFLLVAALVVAVLVVNVVSALVPGMDGALASLPIVVLVLVAGTVLVLAGILRR